MGVQIYVGNGLHFVITLGEVPTVFLNLLHDLAAPALSAMQILHHDNLRYFENLKTSDDSKYLIPPAFG